MDRFDSSELTAANFRHPIEEEIPAKHFRKMLRAGFVVLAFLPAKANADGGIGYYKAMDRCNRCGRFYFPLSVLLVRL
jgi:hypothetical protein